jgi:predicted HTH domain antitoxin
MSETVAIDVPRDVLRAAGLTPEEARVELAVALFAQDRLSFGQARAMAELTPAGFWDLLGSRGIGPHYDVEEYEEDMATLRALGRI